MLRSEFLRLITLAAAAVALSSGCAAHAQLAPAADQAFRQASEAMRLGDLNAAGEGFASVTKLAPAFAEGYMNLGLVRGEQGKQDEAIYNFEKALSFVFGPRRLDVERVPVALFHSNHVVYKGFVSGKHSHVRVT